MTVLRALSQGAAPARTLSNKSRRKMRPRTTVDSRETPEPTRERILNSAARLFAEQGFSGALARTHVGCPLARGGEVDGYRIVRPEALERFRAEQSFGPDQGC